MIEIIISLLLCITVGLGIAFYGSEKENKELIDMVRKEKIRNSVLSNNLYKLEKSLLKQNKPAKKKTKRKIK